MYIDEAIVLGVIVLLACCGMIGYLGHYAWQRMNSDGAAEEE